MAGEPAAPRSRGKRLALTAGFVVAATALSMFAGIMILKLATGQDDVKDAYSLVTSGSMMACSNGPGHYGPDCHGDNHGRLGSIDPGDIILSKSIHDSPIKTFAANESTSWRGTGDVIVFKPHGPGGVPGQVNIVHRAMFFLQINADGSFSVPELGLHNVLHLNDARLLGPEYGLTQNWHVPLQNQNLGPADSGYITKGDNNALADQSPATGQFMLPVRPEWVVGKPTQEVPWIGLLKLRAFNGEEGKLAWNQAPDDVRTFSVITVIAFVVVPIFFDLMQRMQLRLETARPTVGRAHRAAVAAVVADEHPEP